MHGNPQTPAMDWPVGERLMAESSATQDALHMGARVPSPLMLGTTQSLSEVPQQIFERRKNAHCDACFRALIAFDPVLLAHNFTACAVVSPVIQWTSTKVGAYQGAFA